MPVTIPRGLPAKEILDAENVFTMTEERAFHQDIRPLEIALVNLMPTKQSTETQAIRLLANTPLQVNLRLLRMQSHEAKNVASDHLDTFYATFEDVQHSKFDGLIITGAPVETLDFTEVDYWNELVSVLEVVGNGATEAGYMGGEIGYRSRQLSFLD